MPEAEYLDTEYDPWDQPDPSIAILERGGRNRRSKTLFTDIMMSANTGLIAGHGCALIELFRYLHKHHYERAVTQETEDGEVTKYVPEVLSDKEIRDLYPVVRLWEEGHQEQIDHYPSTGGFSIKSTTGMDATERRSRKRGRDEDGEGRRSSQGRGERKELWS